jgi:hypothetical protein
MESIPTTARSVPPPPPPSNSDKGNDDDNAYTVRPIPLARALVVDAGFLSHRRHIIYGLVTVNVTNVRPILRREKWSLTAYIVACLGRAVAADPTVQGYRAKSGGWWWFGGSQHLVVFDNVDVVTMIEPAPGVVAIPHVIRNANRRSIADITDEIRSVQRRPEASPQHHHGRGRGRNNMAARMPRWMRMMCYDWVRRHPHQLKRLMGTVIVTSVGMFGQAGAGGGGGGGFGIGFLPLHNLGVTVGGISTTQAGTASTAHDNDDESGGGAKDNPHPSQIQEYLHLTLAFDHDVVDGAPAARLTQRLVQIMESLELLSTTTDNNANNNNNNDATVQQEEKEQAKSACGSRAPQDGGAENKL